MIWKTQSMVVRLLHAGERCAQESRESASAVHACLVMGRGKVHKGESARLLRFRNGKMHENAVNHSNFVRNVSKRLHRSPVQVRKALS